MNHIQNIRVLSRPIVQRWLLLFGYFQLGTVHRSSGIHFTKSIDVSNSVTTCAIVNTNNRTHGVPSLTRSRSECAMLCTSGPGCVGFNYWTSSKICSVFATYPTGFLIQEGCSFYQTDSKPGVSSVTTSVQHRSSLATTTSSFSTATVTTVALPSTIKRTIQILSNSTLTATTATSCHIYEQIAAENCSFPFTYNGALFYNCIPNVTNVTNVTRCNQTACLLPNRTWAICISPANYSVATATPMYITIPNMNNSTQVMTRNNWIMIQQKLLTDTNVSFNRNWADYRSGFGWFGGNYWLGNENVYQLTNSARYKLRIEVKSTSNGQWSSAEYSSFYIDNEAESYTLHVAGYVGDGGDSMMYTGSWGAYNHNNMMFTTVDRDNDYLLGVNCAATHGGGGWWYDACIWALLNTDNSAEFYWQSLGDPAWYLSASRMMIKRV